MPFAPSIHFPQIALVARELRQVRLCRTLSHPRLASDDGGERGINVARHRDCAANKKVCAAVEPSPEVAHALAHSLLDVDPLRLIARESKIELAQESAAVESDQFLLVEEIVGAA